MRPFTNGFPLPPANGAALLSNAVLTGALVGVAGYLAYRHSPNLTTLAVAVGTVAGAMFLKVRPQHRWILAVGGGAAMFGLLGASLMLHHVVFTPLAVNVLPERSLVYRAWELYDHSVHPIVTAAPVALLGGLVLGSLVSHSAHYVRASWIG